MSTTTASGGPTGADPSSAGPSSAGRSGATSSGRASTVLSWALRILLAVAFVGPGVMKLAGLPDMIALFDSIGVGQWFRYVTGGLEVLGAIGLLIPRLVGPAALGLVAMMVGAIATHLLVIGGNFAMPAALLVLAAALAWLFRAETAALARSVFRAK